MARAVPTQLALLDEPSTAVARNPKPPRAAPPEAPGPARGTARRSATLPSQPSLPLGVTRAALVDEGTRATLERRLRITMGAAVTVAITDNRRTMVSVHRKGGARTVRLHHMFADAPAEVIEAVGRYLARGDRFASKLIDRYIAANQARIRAASAAAPPRLHTRGTVYDLAEIQRALSERYFAGAVAVDITWGRHGTSRKKRRARRTIRMGTYFIEEQLIRIHPALDQAFVPRFFVEWVVYHEMLHHVVPMPLVNGRRVYHSAEFRERERQFAQYEHARAWEETHLAELIRSRQAAAAS